MVAGIAEGEAIDGEPPADYVTRTARAKVANVAGRIPSGFVVGADTVVVIDGAPLGKPSSPDEARAMARYIMSLQAVRRH